MFATRNKKPLPSEKGRTLNLFKQNIAENTKKKERRTNTARKQTFRRGVATLKGSFDDGPSIRPAGRASRRLS